MLSIGEFSNICKLSIKTLRYYSEIDLLKPDQVNPKTGYRYYSITQLEQVLFIKRLKSYNFSLERIKIFLNSQEELNQNILEELNVMKDLFEKRVIETKSLLKQIKKDIVTLGNGKSIMSYLEDIDVKLDHFPKSNIIFIRKKILQSEMELEYQKCFTNLFKKIIDNSLTVLSKPMVLFHSTKFTEDGMDTEFAIEIKECITGTRDFNPRLCLKTVHKGAYSKLSDVYAKQFKFAKKEGYRVSNALFEIYVTDPSDIGEENELITEVYLPVEKATNNEKG
ncbi:MAG: MerR family transcriptional regulator [bacterium]|nr:MerR family transcriptional regulator [bacterium]